MLTDFQARIIAAWWQAPNPGFLASFASTGAIVEGVVGEIGYCIAPAEQDGRSGDTFALLALIRYINEYGLRGPMPFWHACSVWDSRDERELEELFGIGDREE